MTIKYTNQPILKADELVRLNKLYSVFEKYLLFFLSPRSRYKFRGIIGNAYNKMGNYIDDYFLIYLKSWIYLIRNPGSDRNIFISCIPKSGSTYTQKVLEKGLPSCYKHYRSPSVNYNIIGKRFFRLRFRCSIQRMHIHATVENIQYLKKNGIRKYVLMIRDPRDVLISYYYQIEKEGLTSSGFVHLTLEYFRMNKTDKITYLIKYLLPRLADYINSWDSPEIELGKLEILRLYYRDMVSDAKAHFMKILKFYNITDNLFDYSAVRLRKEVRFRRGQVGTWKEYFTDGQTELANNICSEVIKRHGWTT